jgi:hypothetical protein
MEQLQIHAERLKSERPEYLCSALPLGLDSGMGGILLAIAMAARADIPGADELA